MACDIRIFLRTACKALSNSQDPPHTVQALVTPPASKFPQRQKFPEPLQWIHIYRKKYSYVLPERLHRIPLGIASKVSSGEGRVGADAKVQAGEPENPFRGT